MGSLAFRMGRVSPTVDRSARRELRTRSSRRQGRFGREDGQSAVEFALVVPLLLLVIIAILHFGKVMNYWLDLNHVASEGARKAAVNHFSTDAGYEASIPSPATIAVCLPEGSDVGDPVTVQVAANYSLPFIGSTIALRGTATMRLEQPADFAGGGACT